MNIHVKGRIYMANYKDREIRKAEILEAVKRSGTYMTAYKIAKSLNMRPSVHFNRIVGELIGEGKLAYQEIPHRSNRTKFLLSIPEKTQ